MTSVYIVEVCTISMIKTRKSVDNCIQWVSTNAIQIQVCICFLINFSYYSTKNERQVVQWKWGNNLPARVWAKLWLLQSLKIGSSTTGNIDIINVRKQHLSNHSSWENSWHYSHNTTGFRDHYFCGETRGEMEVLLLVVKMIFVFILRILHVVSSYNVKTKHDLFHSTSRRKYSLVALIQN